MVAQFCGEDEARRTAKLFLFGDRSDGQLPFAARVRPPQHDDAAVSAAQLWIAENYVRAGEPGRRDDPRLGVLAPRTFKRRFQAATGYAPLDYVQSLQIEEAKQMLETTDAVDRSDSRGRRLHRTRRLPAHLQARDRHFAPPVPAAVPLGRRGVSLPNPTLRLHAG